MMKKALLLLFLCGMAATSQAQTIYDSITISKIVRRDSLVSEKKIWDRTGEMPANDQQILSLTDSIQLNGTGPIGRCFFPRHRVNFYKAGKISRYLLVCFECNELQFSDDIFPEVFVKDVSTRITQMEWLRKIFAGMIGKDN
jgi:hypothetical protein